MALANLERMAPYNSIDLNRLALSSGEGRRLEVEIQPEQLSLGGQSYTFALDGPTARLDVSRTATGHALRLAFSGRVEGPCMRCLTDAAVPIEVEAREVDQPRTGDDELRSPYVQDDVVNLDAWAHDALALALPAKLLCREDCAGLCSVCGESLNHADPEAHRHDSEGDPRWAALRELKLD
jgi:uncharacterized protein